MSLAPETERKVVLRIKRQSAGEASHWEEFGVPYRANLTVSGCLQWICAHAVCVDGKVTTPPAWEGQCLEETCGACTMLIDGKARPACSATVDQIGDKDTAIQVEPLSKFP